MCKARQPIVLGLFWELLASRMTLPGRAAGRFAPEAALNKTKWSKHILPSLA
jgi:hypothetical protein